VVYPQRIFDILETASPWLGARVAEPTATEMADSPDVVVREHVPADMVLTEGLGHRHVIWGPAVVDRVASFVASLSKFAIVGQKPPNANSAANRGSSGA
jgi:hypothetical protein